jgi:hypothetical protein
VGLTPAPEVLNDQVMAGQSQARREVHRFPLGFGRSRQQRFQQRHPVDALAPGLVEHGHQVSALLAQEASDQR